MQCRKFRYWHLAEAKNDFSSYNGHRSGKIKLLEAALRRELHRIGVNNGDVTAGRRTTERQDNGLLSLFSVLTAPPLSLSFVLIKRRFSLLVLSHNFFDSDQTKDLRLIYKRNFWGSIKHSFYSLRDTRMKKFNSMRLSGAKSSSRVEWLTCAKTRRRLFASVCYYLTFLSYFNSSFAFFQ